MIKLTIAFLFFHLLSYGQNIDGKWELISFQDEKMYYNVENDSVSPKGYWNVKDNMSAFVKKGYKETSLEFTQNKYFILKSLIVGNRNSKYKLDIKNEMIILEEKDINNKNWHFKYAVENDILNLNIAEGIKLRFRKSQ